MRIIKITFENGYCGCADVQCYVLGDVSDDQIDHMFYPDFDQYCDDYAYVADGYPWESVEDGDFMDEEEMLNSREAYYEDCSWGWEDITIAELQDWCNDQGIDFEERYGKEIAEHIAKFN